MGFKIMVIGMVVKVFANGPGDLGSIPGRVISKTQKCYLMPPCLTLSIIRYGSRVKWNNAGKGVAPSPTPWCRSYRKGSLWVTHNYRRQLYLLYNYGKHILIFLLENKISSQDRFFLNSTNQLNFFANRVIYF